MGVGPRCSPCALLALALPLALPAELLLPHGADRGDAALEPGDDARSAALELGTALHFYGAAVRSLYVSADGGGGRLSRWLRGTERSLPLAVAPARAGGGPQSDARGSRPGRAPSAGTLRADGISLCFEHAEVAELPQLLAAPARRENRRLQADPVARPLGSAVVREGLAEASAPEGGVESVGYSEARPMFGTDPNGRV